MEGLEILTGAIGGWAFLLSFLPAIAWGTTGLALLGGAGIGLLLHLLVTIRWGHSLARGIVEAVAMAALTFAVVYGTMWYFTVYLARQPLFKVS